MAVFINSAESTPAPKRTKIAHHTRGARRTARRIRIRITAPPSRRRLDSACQAAFIPSTENSNRLPSGKGCFFIPLGYHNQQKTQNRLDPVIDWQSYYREYRA